LQGVTEVLAYGTAVQVERIPDFSPVVQWGREFGGDCPRAATICAANSSIPILARGSPPDAHFHERRIQQKGAAIDEGWSAASKGCGGFASRRHAPAALIHLQVPLKIERIARGPALPARVRTPEIFCGTTGISPQHGTRFGFAAGCGSLQTIARVRTVKAARLSLQQSRRSR